MITASTLYGTTTQGGYEYDGKNAHVQGFDTCSGCHDTHALSVNAESCVVCHPVVQTEADIRLIRITTGDFDGDDAGYATWTLQLLRAAWIRSQGYYSRSLAADLPR